MSNKKLFAPATNAPKANARNEAGGSAYAFSPEHALAQYAITGTFNTTFYARDDEQLDKVVELVEHASPTFVAKTAVYARTRGFMKDLPAFLAAWLAKSDVKLLSSIFDRVVDNGKMLRNFAQIVRSGVVGRKSFGSAPKRLMRGWFARRSADEIFRASIGNAPSMADVVKMVRPVPKDDVQRALYGWLIGKEVESTNLPAIVRAFEAFKANASGGAVPEVPFEMLTALPLDAGAWQSIAERMSWTQTRMNLATLARHGAFEGDRGAKITSIVAARLRNAELVRKARAFPYQLMSAYKAAGATVPSEVIVALQQAMEVSIENVPSVEGKAYVCLDVSGSMRSAITGYRKGSTSSVQCIDVAALVAAAILRRNPTAEVIPFSDDVVPMPRPLNPFDSVATNAHFLANLPSGGTACSAPLRAMNERKAKGDLVVYVSDNMSWMDFGGMQRATRMAEEWARFKSRNPGAKLCLIDLQPYASTQVAESPDVLNVGGFSDHVFELLAMFVKGTLGADHWVGEIEKVIV